MLHQSQPCQTQYSCLPNALHQFWNSEKKGVCLFVYFSLSQFIDRQTGGQMERDRKLVIKICIFWETLQKSNDSWFPFVCTAKKIRTLIVFCCFSTAIIKTKKLKIENCLFLQFSHFKTKCIIFLSYILKNHCKIFPCSFSCHCFAVYAFPHLLTLSGTCTTLIADSFWGE